MFQDSGFRWQGLGGGSCANLVMEGTCVWCDGGCLRLSIQTYFTAWFAELGRFVASVCNGSVLHCFPLPGD